MTKARLLGGRYELEGVVGRGGMAEVFRARDIRLGRIVGVKTLRNELARDRTFQARFRREAQSAASLNHPSIVAVYDTGEDLVGGAAVPYIVMEFVEGRTLRDLLCDDRGLVRERAAEITEGVLMALDYSHRHGIVHRDIKPGNVMLTPSGDVKVMDFGLARAVSDAQFTLTQTAQVMGTAQYLSPEQARGEPVDARCDLYSTGCSVAKNDAISTNPSHGTRVSKGSAVNLAISKGPAASHPRSRQSQSASPTPTAPSSPGTRTSSPSPSPTRTRPSPSTSCVVNILGNCV
jgi:eukaryotic-like serine/threonine-protein kinase